MSDMGRLHLLKNLFLHSGIEQPLIFSISHLGQWQGSFLRRKMSLRQGRQTKLASVMPSVVTSSIQDSSLHETGVDRFVCIWLHKLHAVAGWLTCGVVNASRLLLEPLTVFFYIYFSWIFHYIGLPTATALIQRLPWGFCCLRNYTWLWPKIKLHIFYTALGNKLKFFAYMLQSSGISLKNIDRAGCFRKNVYAGPENRVEF